MLQKTFQCENFEDCQGLFKHSSYFDSVKYRRTECVKVITKKITRFYPKNSYIHVQRPAFNIIEISEVELIVQKTSGKAKTTFDFVGTVAPLAFFIPVACSLADDIVCFKKCRQSGAFCPLIACYFLSFALSAKIQKSGAFWVSTLSVL